MGRGYTSEQKAYRYARSCHRTSINISTTGNRNKVEKRYKDVERYKEKNAWKQVEPKEGEAKTKVVGDKTYHWCRGHDGAAHRKMWSMHAPNECSIEKSKGKKTAGGDSKAASAKESTTKKNPTLQPNSNLQHALTALTKMFPGRDQTFTAWIFH